MPPLLLASRYQLLRVVARGGMGQVWEATDELLARQVAIKEVRFPSDLPEEELAVLGERTMREAKLTARLTHRSIITIYDVVCVDDRPYIVMELVRAPSLARRVDEQGPLPPRQVAKMGLDLLDALAVAHGEGILHRDVKPSNVLLAADRVVLTDFGIATSESDATLTATGLLVGSPTYMSPERLRGERIGPAADIWSLGATLYAALEGQPPFRAETAMGTITSVLVDEPDPPYVTGPLGQAIVGMLDKNVGRRLTGEQASDLLRSFERMRGAALSGAASAPAGNVGSQPPVMAPVVTWQISPSPWSEDGNGLPAHRSRATGWFAAVGLGAALLVAAALLGTHLWGSTPTATNHRKTEASGGSQHSGHSGRPASQHPGRRRHHPASTPTQAPHSTSLPPSRSTSPTQESASPSVSSTPPTTLPSSSGISAGYRLVHDPLGFQVTVPDGWTRRLSGSTRVDYVSPNDSAMYLRIDQVAQAAPSAVQAWRDYAPSLANELPGFSLIEIRPLHFRGWQAADLEFTWQSSGGTLHVLDRGFITDPRGFALLMSGPESTWRSRSLPVFEVAAATFEPTS